MKWKHRNTLFSQRIYLTSATLVFLFILPAALLSARMVRKIILYNGYILIRLYIILSIVISIHSNCYLRILNNADHSKNDEKQNRLRRLKAAVTEELDIPASIYEQLFHWVLFSSHSLVTANMYSTSQRNVRFVCYTLKLFKIMN